MKSRSDYPYTMYARSPPAQPEMFERVHGIRVITHAGLFYSRKLYNRGITSTPMPAKRKTTSSSRKAAARKQDYVVRVMNVVTGTQQDVQVPGSARRKEYSLWPTFTVYIVGFALLGCSFIAHTLRLYVAFAVLLTLAAGLVIGTAVVRTLRGHY